MIRSRTAEIVGAGTGRETTTLAPSVEEVKAVLEQKEPLPQGQQRVILRVDESGKVIQVPTPVSSASSELGVAPPHANGTLIVQFIGNVPATLVAVRKSHFYDDINVAANYLRGTSDAALRYTLQLIPPSYYDFEKGVDESNGKQRVFPPQQCRDACEGALSRGLPSDAALEDRIIPVEAEEPRALSTRVAAILHPSSFRHPGIYGTHKTRMVEQAAKNAQRELSTLYEAERKTHEEQHALQGPRTGVNQQDQRALIAEIDAVLGPLLDIPRGTAMIPDNVMERIADFVSNQLSEGRYHRALLKWTKQKLRERDPHEIWPIIRWLIDESDRMAEDRIAAEVLSAEPESSESSEEMAFYTVPASPGDVPWAQCECCQKWRALKKPLTTEEESQPWFCYSGSKKEGEAAGMDIRGMSEAVQDISRMLERVRERLRYPTLPQEERETLEEEQEALCSAMCQITSETEDEAMERIEDFSQRVVENPIWTKLMQQYDARVEQREQVEHSLQDLVESRATVRKPKKRPKNGEDQEEKKKEPKPLSQRQQVSHQRLTAGTGAEEDRKMLENVTEAGGTQFIGGNVRDDIDFLEDLIEGRSGEIEDVAAQLHQIEENDGNVAEQQRLIDDLQEEERDLDTDAERKAEIQQQLISLKKSAIGDGAPSKTAIGDEKKTSLAAELKTLLAEQNADRLRVEKLRETQERDPMIPKLVQQGEQNEVYVIRALTDIAKKSEQTPEALKVYAVHYARDVEPLASRYRVAALGSDFGKTGKDVVFSLLDSDKYQFLGARKTPLGSATVKLGKGYFLLRSQITSPNDVEGAVQDLLKKVPSLSIEEIRTKLQRVYEENQVLPYILGGAFLVLANALVSNPSLPPDQLAKLLQDQWNIAPDIADRILQQWNLHVEKVAKESGTRTREQVLKYIQGRAKVQETIRVTGVVPKGSKIPWWTYAGFPVILPRGASPSSSSSISSTLPPGVEISPIIAPTLQACSTCEVAVKPLQTLPAEIKEQSELPVLEQKAADLFRLVASQSTHGVQPPIVRQKRKEKPTTAPLPKRPKVHEGGSCSDADVQRLREYASSLNLFIAQHDTGLKRLCEKLYTPEARTGRAEQFLREWRTAVDDMRQRLIREGGEPSAIPSDITIQQIVLRYGFQTEEKRNESFAILRTLPPNPVPVPE